MTKLYTLSATGSYCCGVQELGDFETHNDVSPYEREYYEFTGSTFKELLDDILAQNKGCVFHIWFAKSKTFDGTFKRQYEWQGLRKLVQKIPYVVHMGTTINPNSGNKIDGYSWINK